MSRSFINFQSELQEFKQSLAAKPDCRISRDILKEHDSWQLFHMHPADNGKKPKSAFYAINKTKVIGRSAFGPVNSAYRVCEETGDLDLKDPYVVKPLKCTKQFTATMLKTEVEILSEHYKTDVLQHTKGAATDHFSDDYFIFTEYVPGQPLISDTTQCIHLGIKYLSLVERFDLITQLAIQLNGFQHARKKRDPHSHFDIRGDNVLLDLSDRKKSRASFIDFGNSKFFKSDDPAQLYKNTRGGMYLYFPPEYTTHQGRESSLWIGLKQDSYALAPLVAILLGAKKPFRFKEEASGGNEFWRLKNKSNKTSAEQKEFALKLKMLIDASYDFEDMLGSDVYPLGYPDEVKQLIIGFVERMQSPDYAKRPDSDELLTFFTTIRIFFKAYEDKKLEDFWEYLGERKERQVLLGHLKKACTQSPQLFKPFSAVAKREEYTSSFRP